MIVFTIFAAALCVLALLKLARVLNKRFPPQPHEPGSWKAPAAGTKWAGREPGFDRIVRQIEKSKTSQADWEKLLTHLDTIADELDPTTTPGQRRAVSFDRGMRFWLPAQRAPSSFNRNYLDARLTALEHRTGGTPRG